MAAFTSKADGNWSASGTTTWTQAGVPGANDTTTIAHNITVDVNTVVGLTAFTTGGTAAIAFSASASNKTLTIGTGVSLTCSGDLVQNSASLTGSNVLMNAGSSLIFKPPSGQQCVWSTDLEFAQVAINGSSGSHCTVKTDLSLSGLNSVMTVAGTTHRSMGIMTASYCDFSNFGTSTQFGIQTSATYPPTTSPVSITNCTFTGCSYLFNGGKDDTFDSNVTFSGNYFISSVVVTSFTASVNIQFQNAPSAGTWIVSKNYFDQGGYLLNKSCTFASNLFAATSSSFITILSGSSWPADSYWSGNCLVRSDAGGSTTNMCGSIKDQYYVMNQTGDVHGMNIAAGQSAWSCTGLIAENSVSGGFGGMIFADAGIASTCAITIKNSILLPNPDGNANELYASLNTTVNPVLTAEHNTICVKGGQTAAFDVGEPGGALNSAAGTVASVRANLAWSPSASADAWVLSDLSATAATNALVSPGASYNGFWNPNTGTCTINSVSTSTPGYNGLVVTNGSLVTTHDVSGNPGFVDSTRNFVAWGTHKGVASSSVANVLTYLGTVANGPLDTLLADLRGWVRAGFVPTLATLKAASYPADASTADAAGNPWAGGAPGIGAMTLAASAGGPFPFFLDQSHSGGFSEMGL